MLSAVKSKEASGILYSHWCSGRRLAALPAHLRPSSREEGYDIQSHLEGVSGAALFGWKIAATSKAGQAHINVDSPMAGRLLQERVIVPNASISLSNIQMRVAEVEFAFRMGHDLPPRQSRYSVEDVMNAVASLHVAIEIPDSRYDDFTTVGAPQLIADNACAHAFVLGQEAPASWRGVDLANFEVTAQVGEKARCVGSGTNVLGDPRIALTWLANELSGLGVPLKLNQVVTTGTCLQPIEVEPGDLVKADFGSLGSLSVGFSR